MKGLENYTIDKIKHLTMAIDQSAFTAIRDRLIEEKAMAEIALKAIQAKPEYFIVSRLFTDGYGTHVELDVYLEQLDASKCRDDHGGVIIPCYTTLPLNSPVIPDGWKLLPVEPTHEMLDAGGGSFGTYDVYRDMLAAAPKPE